MAELTVGIVLSGNFDVSQASDAFGVAPTKMLRRGEPFSEKINKPSIHDFWEYRSSKTNEFEQNLDQHITQMCDIFRERSSTIREFTSEKDIHAVMSCYFDWNEGESLPIIQISSKNLRDMADCGLELDIDIT